MVLFISSYMADGIKIASAESRISRIDASLKDMTAARRERDAAQAQITAAVKSSEEVAGFVNGQMQWSDVLSEISDLVPSDVVLSSISAKRIANMNTNKEEASGSSKSPYVFTVKMEGRTVVGKAGTDTIDSFRKLLESSQRIEQPVKTSPGDGTFNGKPVTVFEINCTAKSER